MDKRLLRGDIVCAEFKSNYNGSHVIKGRRPAVILSINKENGYMVVPLTSTFKQHLRITHTLIPSKWGLKNASVAISEAIDTLPCKQIGDKIGYIDFKSEVWKNLIQHTLCVFTPHLKYYKSDGLSNDRLSVQQGDVVLIKSDINNSSLRLMMVISNNLINSNSKTWIGAAIEERADCDGKHKLSISGIRTCFSVKADKIKTFDKEEIISKLFNLDRQIPNLYKKLSRNIVLGSIDGTKRI